MEETVASSMRKLDEKDWLDRLMIHILGELFGYERSSWWWAFAVYIPLLWTLREYWRIWRGDIRTRIAYQENTE